MTERPYLNFYPSDWRGDPRLRMCSLAARGLWIDLISYMHEGEPYGHLTIDGRAPNEPEISALVARPGREVRAALAELAEKNVFSKTDAGTIFSRRMVRDKAKRDRDASNGKRGGNPKLKPQDNGGVNPQDKAHFQSQVNSEANASDAGASPEARDIRKDLFDRGLKSLASMTGKTSDSCRSLVGKWLKSLNDEAIHVLGAIDDAERNRVADPVAWINRCLDTKRVNHEKPTQRRSLTSVIDRKLTEVMDRGGAENPRDEVRESSPRLLPHG